MPSLHALGASSLLSVLLWLPLAQAQGPPPAEVGPIVQTLDLPFQADPGQPGILGTTNLADVNNRGDLVGNLNFGNNGGFLFEQPGQLTRLACPTLDNIQTTASSVNRYGEVIGACGPIDGQTKGYIYYPGRRNPYVFISVPGSTFVQGFGINDQARHVGIFVDPQTGRERGFFASPGRIRAVDAPFADAQATILTALTNRDAKLGYYADSAGDLHGFILSGSEAIPLDVPEARWTVPLDINEAWQVVGWFRAQDDTVGAFVWQDGVFTTRNLPGNDVLVTEVNGLNNRGQLVGRVILQAPPGSNEEFLSRGFIVTGLQAQPLPQAVAAMASRSQVLDVPTRLMVQDLAWTGEGIPHKGQRWTLR